MINVILPWLAILVGFIGLIWSADRFVDGSAALADSMGVSKLLIGLTVVAFGTSAPEIVVSISSSLKGSGDLAIGNAIGSNLANMGLVLGVTALLAALPIKGYILKQEFPIMLGIMLFAGLFLWDGYLERWEGITLVSFLIPLLFWLVYGKKQHPEEEDDIETMSSMMATFWFIVGLLILIASAEALVWGAQIVATRMGVSPLIIGLTIVAIGTSLPELAASIASTLKGHHDIAIGNIIGSNIFNTMLVMGIPTIIQPIALTDEVFYRDYLAMFVLSLILGAAMLFAYWRSGRRHSRLARPMGAVLLLFYLVYLAYLGMNT